LEGSTGVLTADVHATRQSPRDQAREGSVAGTRLRIRGLDSVASVEQFHQPYLAVDCQSESRVAESSEDFQSWTRVRDHSWRVPPEGPPADAVPALPGLIAPTDLENVGSAG